MKGKEPVLIVIMPLAWLKGILLLGWTMMMSLQIIGLNSLLKIGTINILFYVRIITMFMMKKNNYL